MLWPRNQRIGEFISAELPDNGNATEQAETHDVFIFAQKVPTMPEKTINQQ